MQAQSRLDRLFDSRIFPAFLGTFNYLANLGVLAKRVVQPVEPAHACFPPASSCQRSSACSAPGSGGWSTPATTGTPAMTAPVPPRDLFLAKWILDVGVAALAQLCIGVLFIVSGLLAGALPLQPAGALALAAVRWRLAVSPSAPSSSF